MTRRGPRSNFFPYLLHSCRHSRQDDQVSLLLSVLAPSPLPTSLSVSRTSTTLPTFTRRNRVPGHLPEPSIPQSTYLRAPSRPRRGKGLSLLRPPPVSSLLVPLETGSCRRTFQSPGSSSPVRPRVLSRVVPRSTESSGYRSLDPYPMTCKVGLRGL